MKSLAVIGTLLFAVLSSAPAEEDPFAEPLHEEARPERAILKLPKAVGHRMIDASKHEYVISGLYASAKNEEIERLESTYQALVPDSLQLDLDFEAMKATFSTSKELPLSKLAHAIDEMAQLGGGMPFWAELEARDLEVSKDAPIIRFGVEATSQEASPELAWFDMPTDRAFQIPLSFGGPRVGSFLVVPSTAFCMCHSRFTLRILDTKGKVIWKEEKTAYAGVKIALGNADEFGMHKIWLARDDHGKSEQFLIKGSYIGE